MWDKVMRNYATFVDILRNFARVLVNLRYSRNGLKSTEADSKVLFRRSRQYSAKESMIQVQNRVRFLRRKGFMKAQIFAHLENQIKIWDLQTDSI